MKCLVPQLWRVKQVEKRYPQRLPTAELPTKRLPSPQGFRTNRCGRSFDVALASYRSAGQAFSRLMVPRWAGRHQEQRQNV